MKKIELMYYEEQRPFEFEAVGLELHPLQEEDLYKLVGRLHNTSGRTIRKPQLKPWVSIALIIGEGSRRLRISEEGPESPGARPDEWPPNGIWKFETFPEKLDPHEFAQCTHCHIRFFGETPQPPL